MYILAIDTSCDETSAAVTDGTKVLSNIIWSQASLHAKFGGVMPSLAQRQHEEHIDWVVEKALKSAFPKKDTRDSKLSTRNKKDPKHPVSNIQYPISNIDAVAVTVGPGLSIALGVGISKAKELALKYNSVTGGQKKLIAVNHVESHLFSPFANNEYLVSSIKYPAMGLVVSGGNTQLILINKIGDYKILAETQDDALGEALDKSARLLGLGYPGGAILEKMAKLGDLNKYKLPIPLVGDKVKNRFSYSGVKTSMSRKIEEVKAINGSLTKQNVCDLAASFQDVAFKHIEYVVSYQIVNCKLKIENFLLGGGVAANVELRKRLRNLGKKFGCILHIPYSKKLYGDNAAMIGVCASLNPKYITPDKIDRIPNLKI